MWGVIGQVTSIVSLLAFLAAVIATVLRRRLRHRENLIQSAPEADRTSLVEAVLGRVSVDTENLTRQQRYDLAKKLIARRAERLRWGLGTFATLFLISSILGAYAFVTIDDSRDYTIRVIPVGPDGQPVHGTDVEASVDGVMKQVPSGWDLEVAAAKVPANGLLEVWVRKETSFLSGRAELTLGEELRPTLRVQLGKIETEIAGLVVDEANRPVAGARVFVVGHPENASSGEDGQFVLNAHAADGEAVHLRAEKEGYEPVEEYPYAGDRSVRLTLEEAL